MGFWSRLMGLPDTKETVPDGAKDVSFLPDLTYSYGLQAPWGDSSYGAMYRRQPAVRAVVDFLGRNIGQLNPKVYERIGNSDRLEVSEHPLAVLLRRPNGSTTRYAHLRNTVSDLAIYDRAAWVKLRANSRMQVVRIPPMYLVTEVVDGRTLWVDRRNGARYTRRDLVLFHGYSPDDDSDGVSPLETLRRVLAEESAAQQNREFMWRNAARQSGWIERPAEAPKWSAEARSRFRQDVESTMTGGSNSGRVGVLEEGMKWNGNSFSPKDTEYLAGRRLTYEEVCVQYGMKPGLLGLGGDTASSAEAAHRHAYQDVLGPWLRMIQDEIELQLLPDFEPATTPGRVYVEFNLSEKLKGSFEEQSKSIVSSVGVPYMSINEGRSRLNLPRVDAEWADSPVQPLNVMYGGQPSVVTPTADPGTASATPRRKAAPRGALRRRETAAEQYRKLLVAFYERQEAAVTRAKGKLPAERKAALDPERWARELGTDLFALSWTVSGEMGRRAAEQIDGVYDEERTRNYIAENAKRTAEQVNDHTFAAVEEAEDLDEVRAVFEEAKTTGAQALGLSLATALINFARTEAGRHSTDADGRQRVKTWVVTSRKSRHPEMNGQSVPVDDVFSNGARWPGDPALGGEGAAGCQCLLEIGE